MRSWCWGMAGLMALGGACGVDGPRGASRGASGKASSLAASSLVDVVGTTAALSTPAQRHLVRLQPPNHAPVYLLAVQNDGLTSFEEGLLWYRSDDGGTTWSHYADIVARPDPAGYDPSKQPATLHLTADLVAVGNDVAAVYSYDSTSGTMPADAWDPGRAVYFQWWRFDGVNDWVPGPRSRIAAPGPGQAYHRAELARDSAGRLWIQAFLRQSDCSRPGSSSCVGDLLRAWVSTDGGTSFQGPQTLASVPNGLGGGRLISTGTKLVMLWSDTSAAPARLMTRDDADPVTAWSAPRDAFPDGAHIYHGAALSAVPDGGGGLHLVYKEWVALPDEQQLFYRHFDGTSFGPAIPVGASGDWALQPAITRSGSELYVCSNQTISSASDYEMRSYRLGAGFDTWNVVDGEVQGKAYPAAPDVVPPGDATIPCAFGMGDQTTTWWGPGHVVMVAHEPVQGSATPIAATPTFTPASGTYASAQTVTISDATAGATISYTVDGTTPTASSTPYTGPIAVGATTTIRAVAAAPGLGTSAVASATYTIQGAPPGPTAGDWPFYRGDVLGQSFVDEPVTVADAGGSTVAWTYSGAGSVANPVVVGGIAYVAEQDGTLVALDAATGRAIWSQPIGTMPATSCHPWVSGPVGAPAVVGGTVFAPGGDGRVHAFAKDTGQPLWSTLVANLSASGTASDDFLWSSAFPLHGRIYVGLGTLGESRCGPTPGRVVALDQASGAVVGTWWVDPQHRAGATVWTQPVYDAATNRLFFTTGQGDPSLPLSSQPTAQAFVAVDADTLQPLDVLQPVSAASALDYDFGASPTLVDLPDGRRLIVAANKDGVVYAADRDHLSDGVVWSYQVSVAGDSPDLGVSTIVGAAYAHGTLFVGGGQTPDGFAGAVAALDPATGTPRWVFHPDGFVLASLLAVGDVVVAQANHLADHTGRLYVLDQATGTPVYQRATPGPLYAQATFAAGELLVSDASGPLYALAPASVAPPPPPPPPPSPASVDYGAGFTAAGLQLNGSATLNGSRLRLTSTTAQAGSAFFTTPVSVGAFTTDFRFQLTNPAADGITFTLQGIGPGALGPHGGGLGYGPDTPGAAPGIGRSVAVKFDLYDNAGEGVDSTGLYEDGVSPTVPSVDLSTSGIDLHGGHPFDVHLTYDGATLKMTLTDAVTGATASASFGVDIPAVTGSPTAYAGFTGGTGGLSAIQEVVSWTYTAGAVTQPTAAATPVFTPPAGTYATVQTVTISDATPGATISYTVDGTTPSTSSTPYTGPVAVGATTTLRAIATAPGFTPSAVATATYTIQSTPPGPQVLFADDFARTTGLGASWQTWYGSYATDGANAVSGPAPVQGSWASVVPSLGTNDYAVTATLSIPPGALYSGIVARGNPASFTGDLYAAQLAADGTVNLYRRNQWSWTRLGSAAVGIASGTSYTLALAVTGSSPVHLEVSLGGTTVIAVDDGSGARVVSGIPGLESYDAGVSYGRFEVSAR